MALSESKAMSKQDVDFGLKFAQAELDWIEGKLASHSNVFEWSRERGLMEYRSLVA
jgi:hypothetical protein